jgi:hypothetical protein
MSITKMSVLLFLGFLPLSVFAIPSHISPPGERVVVVDPRINEWGAYTPDGNLVRSGVASTGRSYCPDLHRSCHTPVGSFRIYSLGGPGCVSSKFPLGRGGAPMPYCMYFHGSMALHGSYEVGYAHLSHGCVRLRVSAARWLRYNFVSEGTLVRVLPY